MADGRGRALAFQLAPGQAHELPHTEPLLVRLPRCPQWIVADRGYGAQAFRERIWVMGAKPAIPRKLNAAPVDCSPASPAITTVSSTSVQGSRIGEPWHRDTRKLPHRSQASSPSGQLAIRSDADRPKIKTEVTAQLKNSVLNRLSVNLLFDWPVRQRRSHWVLYFLSILRRQQLRIPRGL